MIVMIMIIITTKLIMIWHQGWLAAVAAMTILLNGAEGSGHNHDGDDDDDDDDDDKDGCLR